METIEWINKVLKELENKRKQYLNSIKLIQEEIKHFTYIKKELKSK